MLAASLEMEPSQSDCAGAAHAVCAYQQSASPSLAQLPL